MLIYFYVDQAMAEHESLLAGTAQHRLKLTLGLPRDSGGYPPELLLDQQVVLDHAAAEGKKWKPPVWPCTVNHRITLSMRRSS
jgi:hypothetical protein